MSDDCEQYEDWDTGAVPHLARAAPPATRRHVYCTMADGARSGTRAPRALERLVQALKCGLGILEISARRELNVKLDVGGDAFGGRVDGLRSNT